MDDTRPPSDVTALESEKGNKEHPKGSIHDLKNLSKSRKLAIYFILCGSLFLDTINNSSLFAAIPPIALQLGIPDGQSVWLLGAYQLTFAALLLVSGRLSDLYNPKWVFIIGAGMMGVFALVDGFIRSKVPLIVLRALMGAGGALTQPAAQHLIVHMYPDPDDQAKAIALFGAMGGIGVVLGLIIGALFVSFVSWPWVFYFTAIMAFTLTFGILVLVPNVKRYDEVEMSRFKKFQRLDLVGVALFTATLILFIFAVTQASVSGWQKAEVIAPIIISAFLLAGFFTWEAWLPEWYAALPPKIWRYDNIVILITVSLIPFTWWGSLFPIFSWEWETVYGWSAIKTGVHFLPVALGIFPAMPVAAVLQSKIGSKFTIMIGFTLLLIGSILLPFGNTKAHYWRFVFPGFIIGTIGNAMIYATANIALLANTPAEVSGIVSALFVSVLQTGGATGLAVVTSIQTSIQAKGGGPTDFQGLADGLWFLVAVVAFIGSLFTIFMKNIPATNVTPKDAMTTQPKDVETPPNEMEEEKNSVEKPMTSS